MSGPILTVCERLQQEGWLAVNDPTGREIDIVALRAGDPPRLVKVLGTSGDPFAGGPAQLDHLSSLAARAGAECFIAYWPPGGLRLVAEREWPLHEVAS
jgi:hypothetical protein